MMPGECKRKREVSAVSTAQKRQLISSELLRLIPQELIINILQMLNWKEVITSVRFVSKTFCLITQDPLLLKNLGYYDKIFPQLMNILINKEKNVDHTLSANLHMLEKVSRIDLQLYPFSLPNLHKLLAALPSLESLKLPQTTSDDTIQHLSKLNSLTKLNLDRTELVTRFGIQSLSELKGLKKLSLKWLYHIEGQRVEHLPSSLISLSLSHWGLLKNTHLSQLPEKIQKLDLSCCFHLSDEGISHLTRLTQLKSLNLNRCDYITNASVAMLPRYLQELDLTFCRQITNECLRDLPPSLQTLIFGNHALDDISFTYLDAFKHLKTLNLSYANFSQTSDIRFPSRIEHLDLSNSQIKNRHLKTLPLCLKTLDISWTMISNKGMKSIERLPCLRQLIISPPDITETTLSNGCMVKVQLQRHTY